jgi:glycolate oxidase FAD binding subunit
MTDTLKPRDDNEVVEAVAWAAAEAKTLEIVGRGTKRAIGRAAQTDLTLDGSGISGIVLYEPEELVLSAKGGTPLAEIEKQLARNRQELPFEPADLGPLLGGKPEAGTIGGMLAANLSGPRRIKAGSARDHALGMKAVSGRGESFKAGGRVVKNVTGYDLPKLLAGSWGTLAVMTEITLKVLPAAEDVATVLALGLADQQAIEAMNAAIGRGADPRAGGLRRKCSPDRVSPRRNRALDRLPPQQTRSAVAPLRQTRAVGRRSFARLLARAARRRAVRRRQQQRGVAHFRRPGIGREDRKRDHRRDRGENFLRLGGRPVVGRDAG